MTASAGPCIFDFLISSRCRTITFGREGKALEIGSLIKLAGLLTRLIRTFAEKRCAQGEQVMAGQHATAFASGKTGLSLGGSGTFAPIEQGKPRAPSIERAPVPRNGLLAPRNAANERSIQPSQQGSARAVQPGVVRISSPIGEVRLNVHRVTNGLAHNNSAAHGGGRNATNKDTIWQSPNSSAAAKAGQGSSAGSAANSAASNPGATAATAAGGNGNNGNGNGGGNGNNGNGNGNGGANGNGKGNNGNGNGNGGGNGHGNGNGGNGNGGNGNRQKCVVDLGYLPPIGPELFASAAVHAINANSGVLHQTGAIEDDQPIEGPRTS
jgi:hypothetical protein